MLYVVQVKGLEPPHLSILDPKSSASAIPPHLRIYRAYSNNLVKKLFVVSPYKLVTHPRLERGTP